MYCTQKSACSHYETVRGNPQGPHEIADHFQEAWHFFWLGIPGTWIGNNYTCFNFNYTPQKLPHPLHLFSMGPCERDWVMWGLELKIRASRQAGSHGSFSVFPLR